MDLFEIASRKRFRFASPQGLLSVEDLWNLPLKGTRPNAANLNDIARALNEKTNASAKDFVDDVAPADVETQQQFDLVMQVIGTKKAEAKAALEAKERAEERKKLLAIKALRDEAKLQNLSDEELEKRIAAVK